METLIDKITLNLDGDAKVSVSRIIGFTIKRNKEPIECLIQLQSGP